MSITEKNVFLYAFWCLGVSRPIFNGQQVRTSPFNQVNFNRKPGHINNGASSNITWNVPSSGELQKLTSDSLNASSGEYGPRMDCSEINLEQNDDELLRMIAELDDINPLENWGSDAITGSSSSISAADMRARLRFIGAKSNSDIRTCMQQSVIITLPEKIARENTIKDNCNNQNYFTSIRVLTA